MDWLSIILLMLIILWGAAAVRYMKKHGNSCSGCTKDCLTCKRKHNKS